MVKLIQIADRIGITPTELSRLKKGTRGFSNRQAFLFQDRYGGDLKEWLLDKEKAPQKIREIIEFEKAMAVAS